MRTALSIRHRLLWLSISSLIGTLLFTVVATAQEPDSETELSPDATFLIRAAKTYGIGETTQKLWHLRATFQSFDAQGTEVDRGTWEETANSFSLRKAFFQSKTFHQTRYVGPWGIKVVGDPGEPPRYFEMLRSAIVSPILNEGFMKQAMENIAINPANNGTLTTEYRVVDGASLHCFDLSIPASTYCFDESGALARFSTGQPFFCQATFKNPLNYEGHLISGDLVIDCESSKLVAHLESIESITVWDQSLFAPPSNAQPLSYGFGRATVTGGFSPSTRLPSSAGLSKAGQLPPGPIHMGMSPDDANSRLSKRIEPVYPPAAVAAGVSGTVVLQVSIDGTGTPGSFHVISGPELLQQAAIDAAKQWRYRPLLVHNRPVLVGTTVNVTFTLPAGP